MKEADTRKEKILIVDDSEMNRAILADMIGDGYEILEAEDGAQAVGILQRMSGDIDLMLLDIVMPQMDGFSVLDAMNRYHWIDDIPVIMVSAESRSTQIERAYNLGVTDFIMRPFDTFIVRHRVVNTLLLYAKQKRLKAMVEQQIYEKEKNSSVMVDIMSHIVEFRNGESGLHVLHVRAITDFLLHKLKQRSVGYDLEEDVISMISTASALHDIGKIGIDEKVLNKPGRLTAEEYEIMKTHSMIGARMLEGLALHQDNPLVKTAYEICRWHHERYDGRGYPDGLVGDEIPISAQVVALADVYDALTSVRIYKAAYDHKTAVRMILNGECGAFNPILLDCLKEYSDGLSRLLEDDVVGAMGRREVQNLVEAALNNKSGTLSAREMRLQDYVRIKDDFFSTATEEIRFEYTVSSRVLTLSSWGARRLGLNEVILDPLNDLRIQDIIDGISWGDITERLQGQTSLENPEISFECKINCDGHFRWHRLTIRAIWTSEEPYTCEGVVGKAVDIHETRVEMEALKNRAARDSLTGLLNYTNSMLQIENRVNTHPDQKFMMLIFDLDDFKLANENFGHQFGNKVLRHVAEVLNKGLRGSDISSRIGGDEFLVFLSCSVDQERVVRRIYDMLREPYEEFPISISMGIARSEDVGADFDALFRAADQALYYVKENNRGGYCFYDESMRDKVFSQAEGADGTAEKTT